MTEPKTDTQIRANATRRMFREVFKIGKFPRDILAKCSDGKWIRKLFFIEDKPRWEKWQKK